jgi:hypothetical protein
LDTAITEVRRAYGDYQQHRADRLAGWAFEKAVRVAGYHVIDVADPLIDERITARGCHRPHVDPKLLADADNRLRVAGNDWAQVHATVRANRRLTEVDDITDDMLFDPATPAPELRWRRATHTAYVEARTAFLALSDRAIGRDDGWMQRRQIRACTYLDVVAQCRPLGLRGSPDLGETVDHLPTAWLDRMFGRTSARQDVAPRVRSTAPHHTLVHRAEDVNPALQDVATLHARRRAAGNTVGLHLGTGVDGRCEALAVGAEAVFAGRFGGLVGDGYRTRDDDHRSLVLGAWVAL